MRGVVNNVSNLFLGLMTQMSMKLGPYGGKRERNGAELTSEEYLLRRQ